MTPLDALAFFVAALAAVSVIATTVIAAAAVRYHLASRRRSRLSPLVPLEPIRRDCAGEPFDYEAWERAWRSPATELDHARMRREQRGGAA
jgi:hypothetical protein